MNLKDMTQEWYAVTDSWDALSQIMTKRFTEQPYLAPIFEHETALLLATCDSFKEALEQNQLHTAESICADFQNQITNFQSFNPNTIVWAYKELNQTIVLTLLNNPSPIRISIKQGAGALGKILKATRFLLKTENHFFNPTEIIAYSQQSRGQFNQTKIIQIHAKNGYRSEDITGPESKQIISLFNLAKIPELQA